MKTFVNIFNELNESETKAYKIKKKVFMESEKVITEDLTEANNTEEIASFDLDLDATDLNNYSDEEYKEEIIKTTKEWLGDLADEVEIEVLSLVGPGGYNPEVRLTGNKEKLANHILNNYGGVDSIEDVYDNYLVSTNEGLTEEVTVEEITKLHNAFEDAIDKDEIQEIIYSISDGALEDEVQKAFDKSIQDGDDLDTLKGLVITTLEDNAEYLDEAAPIDKKEKEDRLASLKTQLEQDGDQLSDDEKEAIEKEIADLEAETLDESASGTEAYDRLVSGDDIFFRDEGGQALLGHYADNYPEPEDYDEGYKPEYGGTEDGLAKAKAAAENKDVWEFIVANDDCSLTGEIYTYCYGQDELMDFLKQLRQVNVVKRLEEAEEEPAPRKLTREEWNKEFGPGADPDVINAGREPEDRVELVEDQIEDARKDSVEKGLLTETGEWDESDEDLLAWKEALRDAAEEIARNVDGEVKIVKGFDAYQGPFAIIATPKYGDIELWSGPEEDLLDAKIAHVGWIEGSISEISELLNMDTIPEENLISESLEEIDTRTYNDEDEAAYYRNKELYSTSHLARHREAMEKAKKACEDKNIKLEEKLNNYETITFSKKVLDTESEEDLKKIANEVKYYSEPTYTRMIEIINGDGSVQYKAGQISDILFQLNEEDKKICEAEVKGLKTVKSQGNIFMLEDETKKIIVGENYNESEGLIENAEIYENKEEANKDYLNRCGITLEEFVEKDLSKDLFGSEAGKRQSEADRALEKYLDLAREVKAGNNDTITLDSAKLLLKNAYIKAKGYYSFEPEEIDRRIAKDIPDLFDDLEEGIISDLKLKHNEKKTAKAINTYRSNKTPENKNKSDEAILKDDKYVHKINAKVDKKFDKANEKAKKIKDKAEKKRNDHYTNITKHYNDLADDIK